MIKTNLYVVRQRRLVRAMRGNRLDALLVWDRANTRYLSGFEGSASVIYLTARRGYFLTDFRYITVASATVPRLRVVLAEQGDSQRLAGILRRHRVRRIGFEETVPFRLYRQWQKDMAGAELIESSQLIRRLRERKGPAEIQYINEAQSATEYAFAQILPHCKPGVTELELARLLLRAIEKGGGDGPAFDPIVASGPNSALPHARPGERKLKKDDLVIFDLGTRKNGYASDMTRTIVIGKATERQKQIYQIVLEAQRKAIARVRDGVAAASVDRAARSVIEKQGFGKRFGHGTGHGVGLEIHESPVLNRKSKDTLRAGMVVTIEPGIYIPGWGGVRIEDMLLVKRAGRMNLTAFPRKMIEWPP